MPVADLDEAALREWGERYGAALAAPVLVTLRGDLGAGKTTLAQSIARGLGLHDDVTSPTYALVQRYESPSGPLYHLDLYRLRDASQLVQLGWDDILASPAITLVEWPERAAEALPAERREIVLEHITGRPDLRRLRWTE